jgi:hypothetical protein
MYDGSACNNALQENFRMKMYLWIRNLSHNIQNIVVQLLDV